MTAGAATRVALIRHGRTQWNAEHRIQGQSDIPLSEEGRRQVAGWKLPDSMRDHAWMSSPLVRAVGTAELMGARSVRRDARLREMAWGAWEGEVLAELRSRYGTELRRNERRGLDFRPPGGESPRELQARLRSWVADLAREGGSWVVVTHRGVIRALYALAVDWDMRDEPPSVLLDECVHLFEVPPGGRTPRVVALNLPLRG